MDLSCCILRLQHFLGTLVWRAPRHKTQLLCISVYSVLVPKVSSSWKKIKRLIRYTQTNKTMSSFRHTNQQYPARFNKGHWKLFHYLHVSSKFRDTRAVRKLLRHSLYSFKKKVNPLKIHQKVYHDNIY